MTDDIKKLDLRGEKERTYYFGKRELTISNPEELEYREGGTTHRVRRADNVWVVPAPGYNGCYIHVSLHPSNTAGNTSK